MKWLQIAVARSRVTIGMDVNSAYKLAQLKMTRAEMTMGRAARCGLPTS